MIKIKDGVKFDIIAPGGYLIIQALKQASRNLERDLVITSGTDGIHSGENDPHHRGEAYDIRTHDFPDNEVKNKLVYMLNMLLGHDFYAFLEDADGNNEHVHVQVAKGVHFDVSNLIEV